MLVQFTPAGGSAVTLADDANAMSGGKIAFNLADFGMDSRVQVTPLFRGANPFKAARKNVEGRIAFDASQSLSSRAAVLTFLKTVYGLVNNTGSLVFTEGTTTFTCASAVLRSARLLGGGMTGVRVTMGYTFEITTVS